LIHQLVAQIARNAFTKAMRFPGDLPLRLPERTAGKPALLYIHIPFCERLCPYCSFHRVVFSETLCRDYFRALRREISLYRDLGYDFGGIYVGGGTPTVLIDELEQTLATARDHFAIREISVETNPDHLTPERLEVLKRAGVDRLSVGVQSFDDGLLRQMDRLEKYGRGEIIAARLKETMGRFDTLNADMIFNFPSQTEAMIERDLATILGLGLDQVTYYPLMVSDMTKERVRQTFGEIDWGKEARLYGIVARRLASAYRFSSAWCFSRREAMIDEYIVAYDDYAGLGSGSIGYLGGTCYANTFDIPAYISMLSQDRPVLPLLAVRPFSVRDRVRYEFLMRLFGMGVDMTELEGKFGGSWRYLWGEILAFGAAGALRCERPHFRLTDRGRYIWVILMREFFTAVNNFRHYCRVRAGY